MSSNKIDGLGDNAGSNFIYLSVRNGKIAMSGTEENHDYFEVNKYDSTKKYYYTLHANVTGFIKGIKKFEKETPDYTSKTLMIHIHNNGNDFSLNMNANSGIASAFYQCMENIDFTKKVQFSASIDKLNPKKNKLWIRQDDQLISYKYTRERPLDLPQAERIQLANGEFLKENGKVKLDFSKQMSFFWGKIEGEIKAKIEAANAGRNKSLDGVNANLNDAEAHINNDDDDQDDFLKSDNLDDTEIKSGGRPVKQEVEETNFPTAEEVFGNVGEDANSPV
jgi:hypothetical protein